LVAPSIGTQAVRVNIAHFLLDGQRRWRAVRYSKVQAVKEQASVPRGKVTLAAMAKLPQAITIVTAIH
jgi:hypothetical protein